MVKHQKGETSGLASTLRHQVFEATQCLRLRSGLKKISGKEIKVVYALKWCMQQSVLRINAILSKQWHQIGSSTKWF